MGLRPFVDGGRPHRRRARGGRDAVAGHDAGQRAGGVARLRIRTRIDAEGVLRDVALVRSDGDAAQARRIQALLEGTQLGAVPPPPGLRQPLLFEVAAQ